MKIQTNEGLVELTAEMVCKGMVFRDRKGETLTVGARVTENIWADVHDPKAHGVLLRWPEFLGCDPTVATRADCERFGVHGDAGGHGFARVLGGGAIDLRRQMLPAGARVQGGGGGYVTVGVDRVDDRPLYAHERFVGLSAAHASPEDVRRMCCGAERLSNEQYDPHRCTLAIGEHEQHEDLATGVKWAAKEIGHRSPNSSATQEGLTVTFGTKRGCPECHAGEGHRCADDCPRVVRYKATRCGAKPARGQVLDTGNYDTGVRIATGKEACVNDKNCVGADHCHDGDFVTLRWTDLPVFLPCPICTSRIMPYDGDIGMMAFAVFDPKKGLARSALVCEDCYRAHGANVAGLRWEGDRLVYPGVRWTYGVDPAQSRDNTVRVSVNVGPVLGFCTFVAGLKRWAASPEGKRAAQERALVALVNACPPYLDPIGWRAAVLACHESYARLKNDAPHPEEWGVLAAVRGCPTGREGTWKRAAEDAACAAYHRAITPAAPVHRVRATWKTRGPVLAVDDGRDE